MSVDYATEDGDIAIADPEDISQSKRIHELLARRKEALDIRNTAFDMVQEGELGAHGARALYQRRITTLIMDLWRKFQTATDDSGNHIGQQYLDEKVIDTVAVEPPAELHQSDAPGFEQPDSKDVPICGLRWFIEHDGFVSATFVGRTLNPPGTRKITQEKPVPLQTLDKALLVCNEFLDETGIDADFSEGEHHTHIDEDLLREVDEWRQEHV